MGKVLEEPSIQLVTRTDLRAARHADECLLADSWASTDIISDRVLFLILPEGRASLPPSPATPPVVQRDERGGWFFSQPRIMRTIDVACSKCFETFFPC